MNFPYLSKILLVTSSVLHFHVTGSSGNMGLKPDTPPNQIDFMKYRFHTPSNRYLEIGSTEGCRNKVTMKFYATPESNRSGECDCSWDSCSRPLLYDKKTDSCYWAWSTGPCKRGEWFVFDSQMFPTCRNRSCPHLSITEEHEGMKYLFENPEDSKCYQAGTAGYCAKGGSRDILIIHPKKLIPHCRHWSVCYPKMIPLSQQCIQGNKYDQTASSNCRP